VGFRIRHAWLFLSRLSGLFGPLAPVVSVEGGPQALILESFSFAEFGHRPKRSLGFHLAVNSFARDQWAHLRQLGVPAAQEAQDEDDDRRPRWDTAPPTTKKEWKSSIGSMKKKTSALMEPDASAPFRASPPVCSTQRLTSSRRRTSKRPPCRRMWRAPVAWRSSDAERWPTPPSEKTQTS